MGLLAHRSFRIIVILPSARVLVVLLGGGRQHFITPVEGPDSKLPACPVQSASIIKPMSAAAGVTKWFAIQVLLDRMLLNFSVQMGTGEFNMTQPLPVRLNKDATRTS